MKLAPQPENFMERIALMANLAPRPLLDTQIAFTGARAIMVAAEVGLFEALGTGDQTAEAVAATCASFYTRPKRRARSACRPSARSRRRVRRRRFSQGAASGSRRGRAGSHGPLFCADKRVGHLVF
jgi:hypothetical protein